MEHHAVAEPLDRPPAVGRRGAVHDVGQACGSRRCRLVPTLLRKLGVAGEVEERDRRRLPCVPRRDPAGLHQLFRDTHDVIEHRVLAMPSLQPRHDRPDERCVLRGLVVDQAVPIAHRKVVAVDALTDCNVEELQTRGDQPLDRPAVEAGESRELLVVGEFECLHEERQHVGVFGTNPVVARRGETELATEPTQELR